MILYNFTKNNDFLSETIDFLSVLIYNITKKGGFFMSNIFSVNHVGYNFSEDISLIIDRPGGIPEYVFVYFFSPMRLIINGNEVISEAESCILYTPDYPQYFHGINEFRNSFFHFNVLDKAFFEKYKIPVNEIFHINRFSELNEIIKHLQNQMFSRDEFTADDIDANLTRFFISIARELYTNESAILYDTNLIKSFKKARLYILKNCEQDWTIEKMAELTHLCKSQFHKYYMQIFHKPPKAELIDARIDRAKYLLMNNSLTIAQVAFSSGFDNIYHFTRYFKKRCKMTPREYTKNLNNYMWRIK